MCQFLKTKDKIWSSGLVILFLLIIILMVINVSGELIGVSWHRNFLIGLLTFVFPVVLVILHATYTCKLWRGLGLFFLAFIIGLAAEIIGVNYQALFGGHYVYQLTGSMAELSATLFNSKLLLAGVPLLVPLYWAVFIYGSFSITNSFLLWLGKTKPNKNLGNYWLLPFLIFLDGLIVVTIDLFMDPLQVNAGNWIWLDGGVYFGVPLTNFFGWFSVTVLITGIVRLIEYFLPTKSQKITTIIWLMPILGYGSLYLVFFAYAWQDKMYGLALIGSLVMLPIVIINLILFYRLKRLTFNASN